ncbi:MAG TPA: dephospho-CoA kinase [Anaerolineaceae bacterium]|nr:dephospho-CoA kinase [Anaerolineaceae bacterium]
MGNWTGKLVIGLTGNIGTGKSVVRRMLEHLGAFGIDADALANRAIAKGAPGYKKVVTKFGQWILKDDGEIDRKKLGRIVFNDPEALVILEGIIHPLVVQALDYIIKRVKHKVVVIEAIKLLESKIGNACDSIWVTYTPAEIQLERLVILRKMSILDAQQRINAQPPQEDKMKAANVVIKNIGSFEDTWKQVYENWLMLVPKQTSESEATLASVQSIEGELTVRRGTPRRSNEITEFLNQFSNNGKKYTRQDVMEMFGEKAFLILQAGDRMVGILGWQVENLIARTVDFLLLEHVPYEKAIPLLINEMEDASGQLQCEVSLLFLTPSMEKQERIWQQLGYELKDPQDLKVIAWTNAATDSKSDGTRLYFKKLRQDRVLRPI